MSETEIFELVRVLVVIGLVVGAAVLATPPNKVPLALRGLMRILKKDSKSADTASLSGQAVPSWKKLLSFGLCILAFVLAKI